MRHLWVVINQVLSLSKEGMRFGFVIGLCLIVGSLGSLVWMVYQPDAAQAHTPSTPSTSEYIDAVIILDNVAQIGPHDPNGDRFSAAKMFVDLALPGDNIGLLKVPSLLDETMQKAKLTKMDDAGKNTLKKALAPDNFGVVKANDTAFFTPALQYAGEMLSHSTQRHRYVIVVTDSAAATGDTNTCPGSPQFQNWLCEVQSLENQQISIVFVTFYQQGDEEELNNTSHHLDSFDSILPLAVQDDDSSFPLRLADAYTNILSDVHPNVFKTEVIDSKTQGLYIDQRLQLESITFVALGSGGVSAHLLNPAGRDTAKGPDTYGGKGSIYWLRTIQATDVLGTSLDGTWHMTPDNDAIQGWIVIAVSQARFKLLDPTPSEQNNDVSPRYVPVQGRIVLHASVNDGNGDPLPLVPLAVSQLSSNPIPLVHQWPDLPGGEDTDVTALLTLDFQQTNQSKPLQVVLGAPLTSSGQTAVYLAKTFPLEAKEELKAISLVPPPQPTPPFPTPMTPIKFGAQIANDPARSVVNTVLYSIAGNNVPPQALTTTNNGNEADAFFRPAYGCGFLYNLASIEQVGGKLNGSHQYEYLAYDDRPYTSYLKEAVDLTEQTAPTTAPSLWSWIFQSQINMTVTLKSSSCTDQIPQVQLDLKKTGTQAPHVTFQTGPDYVLQQSNAAVTISANSQKTVQFTISMNACGIAWDDQDMLLTLSAVPRNGPVAIVGKVQSSVVCPSIRRYPPLIAFTGLLGTLAVLNIFFRTKYALFPLRTYLIGYVDYMIDYESDIPNTTPIPVYMPAEYSLNAWYLDCVQGNYIFARKMLSDVSLLKFSIQTNLMESQVLMVEATESAEGKRFMRFESTGESLTTTPCPCDSPILIDNDRIIPHIDIIEE